MPTYRDPDVIGRVLADTTVWAVVGLGGDPDRRGLSESRSSCRPMASGSCRCIPRAEEVLGEPGYRTLAEIPFAVDVVDIFRRSSDAGRFVDQAIEFEAARGLAPARRRRRGAAARAAAAGLDVVMDTCPKIEWPRHGPRSGVARSAYGRDDAHDVRRYSPHGIVPMNGRDVVLAEHRIANARARLSASSTPREQRTSAARRRRDSRASSPPANRTAKRRAHLLSYDEAVELICRATGWPVGHVWVRGHEGWQSSGAWHDDGPQFAELKATTAPPISAPAAASWPPSCISKLAASCPASKVSARPRRQHAAALGLDGRRRRPGAARGQGRRGARVHHRGRGRARRRSGRGAARGRRPHPPRVPARRDIPVPRRTVATRRSSMPVDLAG